MSPRLRKFALASHLALSVGWMGAVAAYLVLDIAVATSSDAQTLRAAYLAMDLITMRAIVPLALSSLVTGLVMSLGSKWGLFLHYWTLISLILTVLAIIVLLVETQTIGRYAMIAADPATSDSDLRALGSTVLHSVGGIAVLLLITWLNVYKPAGLTRYGWRKQHNQPEGESTTRIPGWAYVIGILVLVLALLSAILRFSGVGPTGHTP